MSTNTLLNSIVIENVLQSKMRGKVTYQSYLPSTIALNLTYVKPYDQPSGKGYQRPIDPKRASDFALYLSKGDDSLFTPILLNAAGNWDFTSYDKTRPSLGRLVCKAKASLMDGQHRIFGIQQYIQETQSEISIPFLAFHYLDEDEEINLFDTINTKAKGIGPSLSKYLRRDSDEISWIATELLTSRKSPFFENGSIIGKRSKGRHITLQNVYRTVNLLTSKIPTLPKQEKLIAAIEFYSALRETFPNEWVDYKGSKLTHIVCLDALSMAGSQVIVKSLSENKRHIDIKLLRRYVVNLKLQVDWSTDGRLKYVKGMSGSKQLANELKEIMLPDE
ncbi:DGQHR domain-containing protein [Brevibacillus fortis]|uniref:DGQHR domain-containing protein n=1 Tax=Brevibacillus fortis TaxID=2126352 RepID=A0A2P7VH37_9BACL|nr:DGQHR domain-containing protein [Brevibacillus fortis]PSJ98535.1 hypothetical protein C7R93_06220 [Brevibacillus fortis]